MVGWGWCFARFRIDLEGYTARSIDSTDPLASLVGHIRTDNDCRDHHNAEADNHLSVINNDDSCADDDSAREHHNPCGDHHNPCSHYDDGHDNYSPYTDDYDSGAYNDDHSSCTAQPGGQ